MDHTISLLPPVPTRTIVFKKDFSITTNRLRKYLNAFYGISPAEWLYREKLTRIIVLLKNNIKNPLKNDRLHWKFSEVEEWEKYYFKAVHRLN